MPDNSDNKNQAKNAAKSYARFKTRKARAILALVLVAVLLFTALVSSFASLIMMMIANEDQNPNEDYQQTFLYVCATDKKTGKPIPNMTINLKQVQEGKDSDGNSNKKTKVSGFTGVSYEESEKKAQEYDLGPTDKDGIAFTLYNVAGMIGGFNYPCPAEFKPDSKGRPTVYYKMLRHGNTFYSQTDGPSNDGHNNKYKGHMGIAKLNPSAAKKDHYKNGQPDATDTWHIIARLSSTSWIPYNTYCYVANNKGYDYGAGIVEDNGGGAKGADVDCYAPYTKYFAPYKDDSSISGHSSKETMQSLNSWLKSCGIPDNTDFFHGNGTVYLMGSDSNASQKAGKAIWSQINKSESQPWPGTTASAPGAIGTKFGDKGSSKTASDSGEKYKILATTPDNSYSAKGVAGKEGVRTVNMAEVRGATSQETGVVVVCGISPKFNLTFWMETHSSVDGVDISGVDITKPQYIETGYGGINTCKHDTYQVNPPRGSALPNCASWVWGRYYDVHGKGPGKVFKGGTKLTQLSQLHPGDYIQWGSNGNHVAFVEQVSSAGVLISESGKTYYKQNLAKKKPHPYYQTGTYSSIDALLEHSKGRPMQVVH